MTALGPLLILLLVGVGVVIVATRLRFPYTVGLVILGVAIGVFTQQFPLFGLRSAASGLFTPSFFFDILLPPIIFEASLHVNFRLFRKRTPFILFLVFVGVLFTTLLTGLAVSYLLALPIVLALLLAAIVSPTDPVAVLELFRRLRVPAELSTIVESESILNDSVGVILFVVLLGIVGAGGWDPLSAGIEFLWMVVGGLAVGLGFAGGVYLLHTQVNDPTVETGVSIVAAYGAFLVATDLGASGIIATAVAGIAVGSWVAPRAIHPDVQDALHTFWNVVVYVVNSLVFLAMGLILSFVQVGENLLVVLLVLALLYLGRAAFVYLHGPLATVLEGRSARLPNVWYNILTLAGIRGVIPIVLALSLYTSATSIAPGRLDMIVSVVVGVAVISVVGGNLTAEWYVRRHFAPEPAGAGGG